MEGWDIMTIMALYGMYCCVCLALHAYLCYGGMWWWWQCVGVLFYGCSTASLHFLHFLHLLPFSI